MLRPAFSRLCAIYKFRGCTHEKLGRPLVLRIFSEYQGNVIEDGSEAIGVYAANV